MTTRDSSFLPSFSRYLCATVLVPLVSVAADGDWPVYLGDAGGTHYSKLTQIDRANVAKLEPAWTYRTGDATDNSQIQCNPLVVDGVLYGTSAGLKLFALDAATGEERWKFDPFANTPGLSRRGGVNRGLVFWHDGAERRILYTAGPHLHAIDPDTGRLIETFGIDGRVDLLEGLDRDTTGLYLAGTSPGAVYRNLIIVSTRVGEGPGPAAPGHIRAYDVRTGERRWIFHTIPPPGEFGHDTWPPDAWKEIGGANNWAGMTIDHERGLAFIPTGSAAFDFWGGNRIGSNLFANCLLVLDAATGRRKWHFQFVHHDLWDRDPPAPPVLCTVTRDGRKVPAVAQVTKSGHVWVFHRETGESLFPWREMPVPSSALEGEVAWPTQPEPLKPAPFARQRFTEEEATERTPAARAAVIARLREVTPHEPFSPPSTRGTVVLPGFDGGAEWGGAAVDPDGVLYVNGNEMAWIHQMIPMRMKGASLGQSLYTQLCVACHAPDRAGNPAGNIPGLVDIGAKLKPADITALLKTGRGMMPAFAFLKPGQRDALIDFLLGLEPTPVNTGAAAVNDGRGKIEPTGDVSGGDIPYSTTGYKRFFDPDGYPALRPPWGTLNAIDLNTGEYRWKRPLGELDELTAQGIPPTGTENYGGPLVTAGGVLFIAATKDEKFRAFDKATGEQLWETTLPAGGYATPATYAVNGRQYIVIACGGGKMGTKSGDSYLAFALPGASSDVKPALATGAARKLEPIEVNGALDRGSGGGLTVPLRGEAARVGDSTAFTSRADTPPRKVIIGTSLARFTGELAERVARAGELLDQAAAEAKRNHKGRGLDLMVLPEYALLNPGTTAAAQAITLDQVAGILGAKAREHRTWLVAPMILREASVKDCYTNAAVLFSREGAVAGIYRKVFPVADPNGVLEGGVTPGSDFPVFECDFGRVGILICWDMVYEEAWEAMARGGAEIVALPSASAQNLRPMAAALRHHYYVVNSTPRTSISVFNPIGLPIAESRSPGVLVCEIDLAYAVLHWSRGLKEGRAFTRKFGSKVGQSYSVQEGTGVFWSNDPTTSIGSMMRELGLWEMPEAIERSRQAQDKARRAGGFPVPLREPGGFENRP